MKRLNPDTGKPFKCGDMRSDGFLFWLYKSNILKSGYFGECWLNEVSFKKQFNRNAKYRNENKIFVRKAIKQHYKNNKAKYLAYSAKRRAAKAQRTPNWLSESQLKDIEEFYIIAQMFQMYTGETYHVDHIVPLRGKHVSGLHVPWNLQVLPSIENIRKGNRHSSIS